MSTMSSASEIMAMFRKKMDEYEKALIDVSNAKIAVIEAQKEAIETAKVADSLKAKHNSLLAVVIVNNPMLDG